MSNLQADAGHYSKVARWLHWAMAVLILGNLAGGLLHDALPDAVMPAHFFSGILVLFLAVLRFLWRLTHRPPPYPESMAGWERWSSLIVHMALYALMILIPLTGWAMMSASPYPVDIYGLFTIPDLPIGESRDLAGAMSERHEILAFAAIGLLLLHIAAALRHHFVKKDGMLARMLG
jgi:cytochrome b561